MNARVSFPLCGCKTPSLKYPKLCFYVQKNRIKQRLPRNFLLPRFPNAETQTWIYKAEKRAGRKEKTSKHLETSEGWSCSWCSHWKAPPCVSLKLGQVQILTIKALYYLRCFHSRWHLLQHTNHLSVTARTSDFQSLRTSTTSEHESLCVFPLWWQSMWSVMTFPTGAKEALHPSPACCQSQRFRVPSDRD